MNTIEIIAAAGAGAGILGAWLRWGIVPVGVAYRIGKAVGRASR